LLGLDGVCALQQVVARLRRGEELPPPTQDGQFPQHANLFPRIFFLESLPPHAVLITRDPHPAFTYLNSSSLRDSPVHIPFFEIEFFFVRNFPSPLDGGVLFSARWMVDLSVTRARLSDKVVSIFRFFPVKGCDVSAPILFFPLELLPPLSDPFVRRTTLLRPAIRDRLPPRITIARLFFIFCRGFFPTTDFQFPSLCQKAPPKASDPRSFSGP